MNITDQYKDRIHNFIKSGETFALDYGKLDEWISSNAGILELLFGGNFDLVSYAGKNKEIAILNINGVIGDFFTNASSVSNAISELEEKKNIKGLILNINSPGGSVNEMEGIQEIIAEYKKEKKIPVLSFIDRLGASAGYSIALQGNKIISSRGSRVGSIGTIAIIANESEALKNQGIEVNIFKSGKYKMFPNSLEKLSEEDKNKIMGMVEENANAFFSDVSKSRNISVEIIKGFEGEVFNANKALSLGLIDAVGNIKFATKEISNTLDNNKINATLNLNTHNRAALNMDELKELETLKAQANQKEVELLKLKAELEEVKATAVNSYMSAYFKASKLQCSEEMKSFLGNCSLKQLKTLEAHLEPLISSRYAPNQVIDASEVNESSISNDDAYDNKVSKEQKDFKNTFDEQLAAIIGGNN